jgi:hypothetical protein
VPPAQGKLSVEKLPRFSIINSLAIVLLLTGIVAMIMMRTLRRDFNRYNEQEHFTRMSTLNHV